MAEGTGRDTRRPARLLIVNTVALNAGDAAILLGELRALRDAFGEDAVIQVADDAPEAAARLYPEIDFVAGLHGGRPPAAPGALGRLTRSIEKRRTSRAVRLLRRSPDRAWKLLDEQARAHLGRMMAADAVIATGGTYLVEHYPLRARTDELLAAQALGRPTFLYTQSMGPFRKGRNRRLMRRTLRGALGVFLRDERSAEHARRLGVPASRLRVRPDAAFALADPAAAGTLEPRDASGPPQSGASPSRPLRVAVSVRYWRHFNQRSEKEGLALYRQSVAAAVRMLADRGAEVVFLSTCQGVGEYWTDDARFARDLRDELLTDVDGVSVDDAFRRPLELMETLRTFDLAVATRMHFAILALAAGVPVTPIAYEFKTSELFNNLDMADLLQDIDAITPASLCGAIERTARELPGLRRRIADRLPGLRRDAADPATMIRSALAGAADRLPTPPDAAPPTADPA